MAVLLPLFPLLHVGMTCDDFSYAAAPHPWWSRAGGVTRPLSSYLLVQWLSAFGGHPLALAVPRIVHHLCNAWLVSRVGKRSFGLVPWAAQLAGVGFAVWGSHGELGFYSSLHDVLATSCVLLGLLVASGAGAWSVWGVGAAAAAAYLCKESAWPLPLWVLLMVPWRHGGATVIRRFVRGAVVCGVVLAAVMAARVAMVDTVRGELEPSIYGDLNVSLLLRSCCKLLLRCVVPGAVDLRQLAQGAKDHFVYLSLAGAAAVLWIGRIASRRRRRPDELSVRLGVCFAASLAPVCMLSVSVDSAENSRYLYLPTVFVVLALAHWVQRTRALAPWQIPSIAVVGTVLVLQGAGLWIASSRYETASTRTQAYRRALIALADRYPKNSQLAVACVPDNYRGALAARNVSETLGGMMKPPRQVIVLGSQDEDGTLVPSCKATAEADVLTLTSADGKARLVPPASPIGATAGSSSLFSWKAENLTRQRRSTRLQVTLPPAALFPCIVSVYDGHSMRVVRR
jgi:hypothetical protein